MKRGGPLKRTPLREGRVSLTRTRLARVGKRKRGAADAEKAFRRAVSGNGVKPCVECLAERRAAKKASGCTYPIATQTPFTHAHHMSGKGRSGGHPQVHNPLNGVPLCATHHRDAHDGRLPQYIKPISYLDTLE